MKKDFTREAYKTPILWQNLRQNIAKNINESGLMLCEIEAIMKDIYLQIQRQAEMELDAALKQEKQEGGESE